MKDKFKSREYFLESLTNVNDLIESMWKNLQIVENDKVSRYLVTYLLSFKYRFIIQYTLDEQFGDYSMECQQLVDALERERNSEFFSNDMVDCLCILVLTNQPEELVTKYLDHLRRFQCDNEIFYMMAGLSGYSQVKKSYPIDYYKNLYNSVIESSTHLLYRFLDDWYKLSSDEVWHDSHLDDSNLSYAGYWCLEAAAIAKTHKLWDDKILNHPHFPKDLII